MSEDKVIQNPKSQKSLDVAMLDFFNWANANIFGAVRRVCDSFFYGIAGLSTALSLPDVDAIKNCTSDTLLLALDFGNSATNMLLNFNSISANAYQMIKCYRAFKLGTAVSANTVADVGNPVTAQTITLTLSNATYYVLFVPTVRACKVEIENGTIIRNTAIGVAGGLPAGVSGILFLTKNTDVTVTLTAALGVGLTTGTNTQLKLYPVTPWAVNELEIWSCSDSE